MIWDGVHTLVEFKDVVKTIVVLPGIIYINKQNIDWDYNFGFQIIYDLEEQFHWYQKVIESNGECL